MPTKGKIKKNLFINHQEHHLAYFHEQVKEKKRKIRVRKSSLSLIVTKKVVVVVARL